MKIFIKITAILCLLGTGQSALAMQQNQPVATDSNAMPLSPQEEKACNQKSIRIWYKLLKKCNKNYWLMWYAFSKEDLPVATPKDRIIFVKIAELFKARLHAAVYAYLGKLTQQNVCLSDIRDVAEKERAQDAITMKKLLDHQEKVSAEIKQSSGAAAVNAAPKIPMTVIMIDGEVLPVGSPRWNYFVNQALPGQE